MPYEGANNYWEGHTTKHGKRDRMSQGSVADRGGYNNMPAYDQENIGKVSGYGFGKKKKKHNPGSHGKY